MTVVGIKATMKWNEPRLVGHLASQLDASGPFLGFADQATIWKILYKFPS